LVEIVKEAELDPAPTVTLGGTVAAAMLSLESATRNPAEGAGELRVTVPVAVLPPTTSVGLTVTDERVGVVVVVGVETVQPESDVLAEVTPSLTTARQSAGLGKLLLSMRNAPDASEIPEACPPLTMILVFGLALCPSILRLDPLNSALVIDTAARAGEASRASKKRPDKVAPKSA
jgi:hypothetical protein